MSGFRIFVVLCVLGIAVLVGLNYEINRRKDNGKLSFFWEMSRVSATDQRIRIINSYWDRMASAKIFADMEALSLRREEAQHVGRLVYRRQNDFANSLRVCGRHLDGSCFEGVLLEVFKDTPVITHMHESTDGWQSWLETVSTSRGGNVALEQWIGQADQICDGLTEYTGYAKFNCTHGFGHLLVQFKQGNIAESLRACSIFPNEQRQFNCWTGVFMDHFIRAKAPERHECNDYADPQGRACFDGFGKKFSRQILENPSLIEIVCGNIRSNEDHRNACIIGTLLRVYQTQKGGEVCDFLQDESARVFCLAIAKKMTDVSTH